MRITSFIILALVANNAFSQDENKEVPNENVKDTFLLKEATVVAQTPAQKGNMFRYDVNQAAMTISVLGEPDVLRHISSLPGVSSGVEGTLGLFVRGGNCGSNGLFFNDVPLYVSSHIMGFVSVFPPEMVENTTFYQGGFSPSKGNMSSSLLDVTSKRQFGTPYNGTVYISPYVSGLYQSLPLIKNKVSLQLSGRTSFAPYFFNWFNKTKSRLDIDVYDLCVKLDNRLSDKSIVDLMYFRTNDNFDYLGAAGNNKVQKWESTIWKAGWNLYVNDQFSLNTVAYKNHVHSVQREKYPYYINPKEDNSRLELSSSLKEWCVSSKMNWVVNNKLTINGGFSTQHQKFYMSNHEYMRTDDISKTYEQNTDNTLNALFAEAKYNVEQLTDVSLGLRLISQSNGKENHNGMDVHILNHWYILSNFGVELSFDKMNQFYHVLEGLPTGWSMNLMTASNDRYPSEETKQFYAGLFVNERIWNSDFRATIGGYYRTMDGLVSYKNARNAFGFSTTSWEKDVCQGKGKSYGLESSISLRSDKVQTSLSYTLSKTDRTYAEMNKGKTFPFKFDRRHILNFEGAYTFAKTKGKRIRYEHTAGCAVSYSSGNHVTLPIGTYKGIEPPYWLRANSGWSCPDEFYLHIYDRQKMSDVNAITMKDYFRTDMSYSMKRIGKRVTNELTLSVYNVFNRHNPYTIFHEDDKWKQLSILPIMPSIRWCISWR